MGRVVVAAQLSSSLAVCRPFVCLTYTPASLTLRLGRAIPSGRLLIVSKKHGCQSSTALRLALHGTPPFIHADLSSECPRQESNLVLDLRTVACVIRHTPRTCYLSVPRRGIEPRLTDSEVCRAIHHTRRACSRVARPGIEPGPTASEAVQCDPHTTGHVLSSRRPDLESNQDQDLRRVLCCPLHHRDTRADDWICTSIIRFTRPAPFSVEPRRH